VAGLRNRPGREAPAVEDTPADTPVDAPADAPVDVPAEEAPQAEEAGRTAAPPAAPAPPPEPEATEVTGVLNGVLGEPPPVPERARQEQAPEPEEAPEPEAPKPAPAPRPAGKRRATGTARPTDLAVAETGAGAERPRARHARVDEVPARNRAQVQLSVAIVLAVVAVVLAGLAVYFRGEANDLTSGDTNTALTDPAATSQVKGQLTNAIKQTFSYNYTDLDRTEKAVRENLTGKALCEYDLLFGEVKKFAPQQKIVLDTTVRELAVVRIDGDRAEALVYIDQLSTRVDVNKTVAVGGQFAVQAHKDGDHWKITEFDMFGQPLVNGKPAPKC
jgi:Mce-associated membrane protein